MPLNQQDILGHAHLREMKGYGCAYDATPGNDDSLAGAGAGARLHLLAA